MMNQSSTNIAQTMEDSDCLIDRSKLHVGLGVIEQRSISKKTVVRAVLDHAQRIRVAGNGRCKYMSGEYILQNKRCLSVTVLHTRMIKKSTYPSTGSTKDLHPKLP